MDEKLAILLKDPENKACFDCGAGNPKWASVNNAVFVCLNCAGLHRGVGVNYSFIRSLTMDNWDDNQIKLLTIGGNNRLKLVLQEFGIPLEIKIDTKYRLRALDYYRKLLRAEAFGEQMPVKPDIVSAFEVAEEEVREKEGAEQSLPQLMSPPEKSQPVAESDFFGKVGMFFQKGANDIQKGFQDFKEKVKESNIEGKAIDFKNKAFTSIEEKTNVVVTSVSSFFKKTTDFFTKKKDEKEVTEEDKSAKSAINLSPSANIKEDAKEDNKPQSDNNDPDQPPKI